MGLSLVCTQQCEYRDIEKEMLIGKRRTEERLSLAVKML